MKVVCPQCDSLFPLERFRVEAGVLTVTCTKCGADSSATQGAPSSPPPSSPVALAAAASTPSGVHGQLARSLVSSPEASNVVSLKTAATGAVERAADAARKDPFEVPSGLCPKCLAKRVERAASCALCGLVYARLDVRSLAPPAWLADAWRSLLEQWGDEAQHEKLRKRALQTDSLAAVGRLYRLRLVSVPDDPYALKGRDDVVKLATAPVTFRPMEPTSSAPSRAKLVGVAVLMSAAVGLVIVFLRTLLARGAP
ncbi:MAG: hypothetical protein JNG84_14445 [Archangium sp.]|nr:hypothetical protein [Archangium sp.]